jgi:hypothetical protein
VRSLLSKLFQRTSDSGRPSDLERLTHLVRRYSVEQQQVPKNLNDLVLLNYLEAIPVAPPHQQFVIDRKKVEVRLEENRNPLNFGQPSQG